MIHKYDLNRFIVASCTPRTHEPLFRNTLREAGLNQFLFELVNIRDQDSWVHQHEPEKATEKAKDLIRMYLAKVVNLKPLQKIKVKVEQSTLVIGGGIAGVVSALNLARQGFTVYLVEREESIGGQALEFTNIYDIPLSKENLLNFVNQLKSMDNVHILTNSKIEDIRGFVGNYQIKTQDLTDSQKREDFSVGTIIVATGTNQIKTERWKEIQDKYDKRVFTQKEFEETSEKDISNYKAATIILCVDQRANECNKGDSIKSYCSNVCCKVALKNIEKLLRINPKAQIHVLYREMQFSDINAESLWRDLRKKVMFERYESINDIHLSANGEAFHVKYNNIGAECEVEYDSDLLILATPEVPAEGTKDLAMMLKVPTTKDGFFLEAHVKLRPIDFATEGIFLCGNAHWPKWIDESIEQGFGAAGRAAMLMVKGEVETEGITSEVDPEKCIGCGRCAEICPYNAIEMIETTKEMGLYTVTDKKAHIIDAVCKGCGACAAECPLGAIDQKHFSRFQIKKQIDLLTGIDLKACQEE
jgi:heterodisulfide reductase subunit A